LINIFFDYSFTRLATTAIRSKTSWLRYCCGRLDIRVRVLTRINHRGLDRNAGLGVGVGFFIGLIRIHKEIFFLCYEIGKKISDKFFSRKKRNIKGGFGRE